MINVFGDIPTEWPAVAAATLAILILGFVWYNDRVFGKIWRKSINLKEPSNKAEQIKPILVLIIWASVISLVLSKIAYLTHLYTGSDSWTETTLSTGLVMGATFPFMSLVMHLMFEQRSLKSILVSALYTFVSVMIAAAIVGTIGTPEVFNN